MFIKQKVFTHCPLPIQKLYWLSLMLDGGGNLLSGDGFPELSASRLRPASSAFNLQNDTVVYRSQPGRHISC
jgi:hypothetical protein